MSNTYPIAQSNYPFSLTEQIQSSIPKAQDFQIEKINFSGEINGVKVIIEFNTQTHVFLALFKRQEEIYIPQECIFHARSWECLIQKIEAEMRTAPFQLFIGILAKQKMLKEIRKSEPLFQPENWDALIRA